MASLGACAVRGDCVGICAYYVRLNKAANARGFVIAPRAQMREGFRMR
jgi:hypothetical protein